MHTHTNGFFIPSKPVFSSEPFRVFVAILFALYSSLAFFHVSSELHLIGALGKISDVTQHHESGPERLQHEHDRHHTPHNSADHTILAALKAPATGSIVPPLVSLFAFVSFSTCGESSTLITAHLPDNDRCSGRSPPDPKQPGAPPILVN